MEFSAEKALWFLSAVSLVGVPGFLALFLSGARKAIRTDDPVSTAEVPQDLPGVSVLKPCAGADDDLEACLESYCAQRYPKMQILFGVRDEKDAAYPVVKRVKERHPELDIEVVLSGDPRLPSPKISNVEVMARKMKHELLWLSDSNTRVHPDTLWGMVQKLQAPGVGMVVSPVVGDREKTDGSALDAMMLNTLIGITTYAIHRMLGEVTAPGKSVLTHKNTLEAIGGWEELGKYFGEDFIFMDSILRLGKRLVLGDHLVTNVTTSASFQKFVARHLRWAQIRWRVKPEAAWAEFLLSPAVPTAFLFLCCPMALTAQLFLLGVLLQVVVDQVVVHRLRGSFLPLQRLHLLIARPFIALYFTARGIFPGRVEWRGNFLYMGPRGKCLHEPALQHRLRELRTSLRLNS